MLRVGIVTTFFLLVCGAAGPVALAGDEDALTAGEKRFLKALAAGLTDKSDSVRSASEEAFVLVGSKAAGYLVAEAGKIKVSARPAVTRILVRLGEPAIAAIKALGKTPRGRAAAIFDDVRAELTGAGGIGGFGDPDPGVAAKVRDIMAGIPKTSFSSDDPAVEALIALGRSAIPVLLDFLNPSNPHRMGMEDTAAKAALGGLVVNEDTPKLCRLLDLGWLDISAVLTSLGDESCVPALIRAMERGQMSWELASAIERFAGSTLRGPIVAFLRKHGREFPYGTRSLLDVVARDRIDDALPAVQRMADVPLTGEPNERSNRVAVGRALALLGDAKGIPILIGCLVPQDSHDKWTCRNAGETLNAITGLALWTESAEPRKVRTAYQGWWEGNRNRLQFDRAMRRYEVRK